jgi:hypothetical protein
VAWRVAESIDKLFDQVNAAHPTRSKASDGTIGDPSHASRESDHNPWVKDGDMGVVTAGDITHDPAHGQDNNVMVAGIVKSRDPRIKYIIWNGRIISSTISPWVWREYTGDNPHTKHAHISVLPVKTRYDSRATWAITVPPPAKKRVRFELWDAGKKHSESLSVEAGSGELARLQAFLAKVDAGILQRLRAEGNVGDVTIKRRVL